MCDHDCVLFLFFNSNSTYTSTMVDLSPDTAAALTVFVFSGMSVFFASMIFVCMFKLWRRTSALGNGPPANLVLAAPTTPRTPVITVNRQSRARESCYACMDSEANTYLLNCGHSGLCVACARKIIQANQHCPLCRQAIAGIVHMNEEENVV